MSDTDQMVNLMGHAARRLGEATKAVQDHAGSSWNMAEQRLFVNVVAAMAEGRAVLAMVAASVAPEGRERSIELMTGLLGYDDWADANDGVVLSPGEIQSVARFLRTLVSPS